VEDCRLLKLLQSKIVEWMSEKLTQSLHLHFKARNVCFILQSMHTLYCFIIHYILYIVHLVFYTEYFRSSVYPNKLYFLVLECIFSSQPKFLLSFFKFMVFKANWMFQ